MLVDTEEPTRPVELYSGPTLAAPSQRERVSTRDERSIGPGDHIGRFTMLRELGAGGMGVVYEAHDPDLGRKVALKLMIGDGPEARARLRREAQAMARVTHPNVATVHEVGEVDALIYVAMELIEGATLGEWLATPRDWPERLRMLLAAGEGLAAAHAAGLIHRDFKPSNVMVGADERPRVLDFGLVRSAADAVVSEARDDLSSEAAVSFHPGELTSPLTRVGAVMGTPAYMSPEQLTGAEVDARSDQFSFCVCVYEALLGARPFPAETLTELRESVREGPRAPTRGALPARVNAIILRGLEPDPARRWPSMRALLSALHEQLTLHSDPERDVSVGRRQRTALLLGLVALLLITKQIVELIGDPAVLLADPKNGLIFGSATVSTALLVLLVARRWVGRNRVNRNILALIAAYAIALWLNRLAGVALDIGWPEIFIFDFISYTVLALLGGSAIHSSLYGLAAALALALAISCARPDIAPQVGLFVNIGSLAALALVWRGRRDQAAAEAAMTRSTSA